MSEVNGGLAQLAGGEPGAVAAVARQDAAVAHAASYQCAECSAVAAVDRGAWVRVIHAVSCSRRRLRRPAVRAGRRLAACAQAAPRPPRAAEAVPSAETEPAARQVEPAAQVRHANRGRRPRHHAVVPQGPFTDRGRAGVRAGVVARWFVSGCRVLVQGWAATCRRIVREAGRLLVSVDFDEWDVNEPFDIFELGIFERAAA